MLYSESLSPSRRTPSDTCNFPPTSRSQIKYCMYVIFVIDKTKQTKSLLKPDSPKKPPVMLKQRFKSIFIQQERCQLNPTVLTESLFCHTQLDNQCRKFFRKYIFNIVVSCVKQRSTLHRVYCSLLVLLSSNVAHLVQSENEIQLSKCRYLRV